MSNNDHECIMRERIAEGDTKFALLDNQLKSMNDKVDKVEIKVDKLEIKVDRIENGVNDIKLLFANFKEEIQKDKTQIEKDKIQVEKDLKERINSKFITKLEFWVIRVLVYGFAGTILIQTINEWLIKK